MLRLERLVLNGFKSFSTSTEFHFGPGITAVVGPNGCGKSNIADALNWVIGEQSHKSLRAEQMGDVIFNGTDARRPLGMSEVSLHLSGIEESLLVIPPDDPLVAGDGDAASGGNGAGPAAPDGNGSAAAAGGLDPGGVAARSGPTAGGNGGPAPAEPRTIQITRRLFRSGESEYLIDGRRCRLKDIQRLLAEARVGSGVYAVIEQGRVDAVLASRPRDRRVLIEEAAGIALYKVRKRQAQAKLEATESNLLRINDLVSEIERQINALKRQAARARRYARLTEAMDRAERILFHQESARIEAAAAGLAARRAAIEDEESGAAAALAASEARLEADHQAAADAEAAHRDARDALHALDRAIDHLQQGVGRWREEETEAAAQAARAGAETEHLLARLAEIEARSAALGQDLRAALEDSARGDAALAAREASARLEAAALSSAEASLGAAREDVVAAAGALSESRNEMRRLQESLARADAEEVKAASLAEEARSEAASIASRRAARSADLSAASAALAEARRAAEAAASLLEQEEAARERLLLEREDLRGRLAATLERIAGLGALEAASVEDVAAVTGGAPLRPIRDLLSPPERLDRAVDAALKGLLRGYVTGSLEEAAAAISALKSRGRGRAVLVPERPDAAGGSRAPAEARPAPPRTLGSLEDLLRPQARVAAPLGPLLRRILVAEDLEAALAARAASPDHDVVTLQGDFLSREGWVEGGAELPEEAGVMTLRRLLERLSAQAESSRGRISDLDAAIRGAEERAEEHRAAKDRWNRGAAELAIEEEALRLRSSALEEEASRLSLRLGGLDGDRARLAEDRDDLGRSLRSAARSHADLLARHEALQRAVEEGTRICEETRAAVSRLGESLAALRSGAAGARERRAALEAEERHLEAATRDVMERIEGGTADRARWESRASEARARAEADGKGLADRMAERILADGAAASAEAALLESRAGLPRLEAGVREARRRLEEVRERLHAAALEEERLAGDRRGLESRAAERGWPSVAAAAAGLSEEEGARDPVAVRAELADLKEKRDAMGAVNLMAVDQFRELEERHAFITRQRRDLEDSIRSLKETIARINRQSRERFLDAFEKIRAEFGRVFQTLFTGGRADLRLAAEPGAEDDVLEAGLEIIAQPPGKRLQSISLMSGGEKALTAIALLFAIFKYSPSPFCLLDEVDAPLDEANVMRFTSLLRKMTQETQFIIITHSRRTMESADVLYGVTMDEPGVSKTVSVVLTSEEHRRETARTLPALMAERHRGNGGRRRAVTGPAADA